MADIAETTQILLEAANGDSSATDRLLPAVYDELRALARDRMRRERPGHTLQATALVNEAYLRLVDVRKSDWASKSHFLAVAGVELRRVLVDHARRRRAEKRGGDRERVVLSIALADSQRTIDVDVELLDQAIEELRSLNERQATIVELHALGGLPQRAIADRLRVSTDTVKRDWRFARAWMRGRLGLGVDD